MLCTDASRTTTTSSTEGDICNYMSSSQSTNGSSSGIKCHSAKAPLPPRRDKPHIKKTDSSMQTEALSVLNSMAWKKYLHDRHFMRVSSVSPRSSLTSNEESPKHAVHDMRKYCRDLEQTSEKGSTLSLTEEKHVHEIRRLRRELQQSQERVATLTSQMSTNTHMVTAFEQSLSTMTARLQQLTNALDEKDCEVEHLRATMESLRKQGIIVNSNQCN